MKFYLVIQKFFCLSTVFLIPVVTCGSEDTPIEPCSCDITENTCETNCCCDPDCSAIQLSAFQCKNNTRNAVEHLHNWKCSNSPRSSPDIAIHQFLCIHKENTPYLGTIFPNVATATDLPALNGILSRKSGKKTVISSSVPKTGTQGYIYGQKLVIITANYRTGRFYLPVNLYSSRCDALRPVRYLTDISTKCAVNLRENCDSKRPSFFNVKAFLAGKKQLNVLGSPFDESGLQIVNSEFYFRNCTQDITNCEKYRMNDVVDLNSMVPIRNGNFCKNVVESVNYTFSWKGGEIVSADVEIVFGIGKNFTDFWQQFTVKFKHLNDRNVEKNLTKLRRKDTTGFYRNSDILVGGINEFTDLVNETTFNQTTLLGLQNDAVGTCALATDPILFGVDKLTGCIFSVNSTLRNNCTVIKENLKFLLDEVYAVDFLSRGPNFNVDNLVPVVLMNDDDADESQLNKVHNSSEICPKVPNHVHLDVIYTMVENPFKRQLYKVLSSTKRYNTIFVNWRQEAIPIYSSVKFHFLSTSKDSLLKERTKRYWLSNYPVEQCLEESCWEAILYPWSSSSSSSSVSDIFQLDSLQDFLGFAFLFALLVISTLFLFYNKICKTSSL